MLTAQIGRNRFYEKPGDDLAGASMPPHDQALDPSRTQTNRALEFVLRKVRAGNLQPVELSEDDRTPAGLPGWLSLRQPGDIGYYTSVRKEGDRTFLKVSLLVSGGGGFLRSPGKELDKLGKELLADPGAKALGVRADKPFTCEVGIGPVPKRKVRQLDLRFAF